MRTSLPLLTAGIVFLGSAASAQVVRPIAPLGAPRQVSSAAAGRAAQGAQSMIHGTAVDANNVPLAGSAVRLRNLQTGQVEQVATAGPQGEFTFPARPEVPYVVEITNQAGQVIAVGDVIVTQAGDVAGARVSLPTRLPQLAGIFGETASSVVSAASGTGVTALSSAGAIMQEAPPVASPEK